MIYSHTKSDGKITLKTDCTYLCLSVLLFLTVYETNKRINTLGEVNFG